MTKKTICSKRVKTASKNWLDCEWVTDELGQCFRCYHNEKFIWAKRFKGEIPTKEQFEDFVTKSKEEQ